MEKIKDLKRFYEFMLMTREVKKQIFDLYIQNRKDEIIEQDLVGKLEDFLSSLENIPQKDQGYYLSVDDKRTMRIDLSYEINELKKDIYFLKHSEAEFNDHLKTIHPDFEISVNGLAEILGKVKFKNFITDRDGTVNNYCGRYLTSVQSVYNAVFLYRFASTAVDNAVLLTSAPLDNIGMADISILPKTVFIYAGSKGREYFDKQGIRHQYPVSKQKQDKLDSLNQQIKQLLEKPEYEIFGLIGSGLQLKFGQTTIARQDISSTVTEEESIGFLNSVRHLVRCLDPDDEFFRIEDTGKDIEIILTIADEQEKDKLKDFDKGDSVNFLDKSLNFGIEQGPVLICGDTGSDVAMVKAAMFKTNDTWAVFVTKDGGLKKKVQEICPNSFFVPEPDMLVAVLNRIATS
jgi:hypothetical protein